MTNHWFTRVESHLIMNILKIATIKTDLDPSVYYELAVKSLSIFHEGQKDDIIECLFKKIIFNSDFYPNETRLQNLDLNSRNVSLETSLNNLDEISTVYVQILGLKQVRNPQNYQFPKYQSQQNTQSKQWADITSGNLIPIDWIYSPIIVLYSNQEKNKALTETEQVFLIKNCLRWVLIYETYFPGLASCIHPTDRFCRLACVFLASDDLFLVPEIHELLELCLGNISAFLDQIDFDKEIQGNLLHFSKAFSFILLVHRIK